MTPRLGGTAMGEFVAPSLSRRPAAAAANARPPLFSSRASSITFSSSKESTSSARASLSARPYSIEETTRYLFPPAAPSTRRQITGSGARKPERWYTEASCWERRLRVASVLPCYPFPSFLRMRWLFYCGSSYRDARPRRRILRYNPKDGRAGQHEGPSREGVGQGTSGAPGRWWRRPRCRV